MYHYSSTHPFTMQGDDTRITGNVCGTNGGGVYVNTSGTLTIDGTANTHLTMISGNTSDNVYALGTVGGTTGATGGW